MSWEILINFKARLNLSILYIFTGQFGKAVKTVDPEWALVYGVIFAFAIYDSYRSNVEVNLFAFHFDTSLLFEVWVFPTLCILYNQVTRERGLWPVLYWAVLFSAGITAVEYPLELYTDLIEYINWYWYYTFASLIGAFLASRAFIAFYRLGCRHFGRFL